MRFFKTTVATAALGAAFLMPIGPAAAAPLGLGATALGTAGQQTSPVQDVQLRWGGGGYRGGWGGYRGGWGGYRGGWGGYRGGGWGGGWGWGGLGAGLAAGALLGGALAAPYAYAAAPYYYDRPYYGGYYGSPYYAYASATPVRDVAYCMRRFRSFDPRTMTYLGYDGRRHSCP